MAVGLSIVAAAFACVLSGIALSGGTGLLYGREAPRANNQTARLQDAIDNPPNGTVVVDPGFDLTGAIAACCATTNVLLADLETCLQTGTCLQNAPSLTFDSVSLTGNLSSFSIGGSINSTLRCTEPLPSGAGCMPGSISATNLQVASLSDLGLVTSCLNPLDSSCNNIGNHSCPNGPIQSNCRTMNMTFDVLTISGRATLRVNTSLVPVAELSGAPLNATMPVTLKGSLSLGTSTICPVGAVVNKNCALLNENTTCSSYLPGQCYPPDLNFFTVRIRDTLSVPANTQCPGSPYPTACLSGNASNVFLRDSLAAIDASFLRFTGNITSSAYFWGALSGDYEGLVQATNNSITKIKGRSIPQVDEIAPNSLPQYNGSAWKSRTYNQMFASYNSAGTGDLTGSIPASVLSSVIGVPIAVGENPPVGAVATFNGTHWTHKHFDPPAMSTTFPVMRARLLAGTNYSTVGTASPWLVQKGNAYANITGSDNVTYYVAPIAGTYSTRMTTTIRRNDGETWLTAHGPAFFVNDVFAEYVSDFGVVMPATPAITATEGGAVMALNAGDRISVGLSSGALCSLLCTTGETLRSSWEVTRLF